jgi:hypothetical protein
MRCSITQQWIHLAETNIGHIVAIVFSITSRLWCYCSIVITLNSNI